MALSERFRLAFGESYTKVAAAPELVPMVLAQACVDVLPVAGAGLSMTDELRVPLGSSGSDAAEAERLQTTLGEGPCLAATAQQEPFTADLATMAQRWPTFHRQLLARTPFRSVVSFPLRASHQLPFGALDLYLTTDELPDELSIPEVASNIAGPMAHIVFALPSASSTGISIPPWLDVAPAANRMRVWVAVGMLIERFNLTNLTALAALRSYASKHETSLDDTADQLMNARLTVDTILG